MTMPQPFNPLALDNLAESIAVRIMAQTPTPLGSLTKFHGPGVYAIFYTGEHEPFPPYADLARVNQPGELTTPIYVGKAELEGKRQGGGTTTVATSATLYNRLRKHARSIEAAQNLDIRDFYARWIIIDAIWVALGENGTIARFQPVWNRLIDGFGINAPGAGRGAQQRSRWDTLHPGRGYADSLPARNETADDIAQDVKQYLSSRVGGTGPIVTPVTAATLDSELAENVDEEP